jgi:hypothetical protein
MTEPASPPVPPPPNYTGGQIVMVLFGILFLLPGLCSLFFVVGSLADWISKGHADPYLEPFVVLWAICFAISAAGIAMIVVARKRAQKPR